MYHIEYNIKKKHEFEENSKTFYLKNFESLNIRKRKEKMYGVLRNQYTQTSERHWKSAEKLRKLSLNFYEFCCKINSDTGSQNFQRRQGVGD